MFYIRIKIWNHTSIIWRQKTVYNSFHDMEVRLKLWNYEINAKKDLNKINESRFHINIWMTPYFDKR